LYFRFFFFFFFTEDNPIKELTITFTRNVTFFTKGKPMQYLHNAMQHLLKSFYFFHLVLYNNTKIALLFKDTFRKEYKNLPEEASIHLTPLFCH